MTASTTRVTVVAVFSNISAAHSAASELTSTGFPIGGIYLHSGETAAVANRPEYADRHSGHPEGGIKDWFKSIFGSEEGSEAQRDYEEAFSSGNTILALDTTEEEAERAADILNRHSPINVHAEAGPASAQTIAGTSVGTRGNLGGSRSHQSSTDARGTESGSIPVVKEELTIGKRAILRGGVRIHSRVV